MVRVLYFENGQAKITSTNSPNFSNPTLHVIPYAKMHDSDIAD